jgi:large subunit ribosomal protein L22
MDISYLTNKLFFQFVCLTKNNIKYSLKKMWYVSSFIRGMSIDEALKQLSFVLKKGGEDVRNALLEAQEMAVRDHNVEFKSNLWVAESFCGKGKYVKGVRRHARSRHGRVEYKYVHYFVRLEEGEPPQQYGVSHVIPPEQQLDKWIEEMRNRKVINSL